MGKVYLIMNLTDLKKEFSREKLLDIITLYCKYIDSDDSIPNYLRNHFIGLYGIDFSYSSVVMTAYSRIIKLLNSSTKNILVTLNEYQVRQYDALINLGFEATKFNHNRNSTNDVAILYLDIKNFKYKIIYEELKKFSSIDKFLNHVYTERV